MLVPIGLFGGPPGHRQPPSHRRPGRARRRRRPRSTRSDHPHPDARRPRTRRSPGSPATTSWRRCADSTDRFTARGGPFSSYERTLATDADGEAVETIDYELAPMVWSWLLGHPYRMALGRRPRHGHRPWWSPPEAPDARGCTALGALCYLGARLRVHRHPPHPDHHVRGRRVRRQQDGAERGAVARAHRGARRAGGHDPRRPARAASRGPRLRGGRLRRWRRCPALAPDLVTLGVAQTVVRGCATAGGVLVAIVAAEEMPSGSRAFAFSLLAAAGAFGAGPLPDGPPARRHRRPRLAAGDGAPRCCCCRSSRLAARHLPESRRYDAAHAEVGMAGHGSRFWLLAASALLLALFTAPAAQLLNEFLRDEEGFSALADHRSSASSPTRPEASVW